MSKNFSPNQRKFRKWEQPRQMVCCGEEFVALNGVAGWRGIGNISLKQKFHWSRNFIEAEFDCSGVRLYLYHTDRSAASIAQNCMVMLPKVAIYKIVVPQLLKLAKKKKKAPKFEAWVCHVLLVRCIIRIKRLYWECSWGPGGIMTEVTYNDRLA